MNLFNNYFSFSRGEKRGVLVLVIIIITLIISNQFISHFKINYQTDFSEFENAINEFEKGQKINFNHDKKNRSITYFKFNPNTISDSAWKQLGFEEWQIKIINNYKAKGGSWKTKSDVRKIYGLNDSIFTLLEPFILLPRKIEYSTFSSSQKREKKETHFSKEIKKISININTADTSELKELKGIGNIYAKRIIKYRDLLGGFVNINQIKEVYGMNNETFNQIAPYLVFKNDSIRKININTSSVKSIKSHPYINWNIANAIVNYRKTHGNYNNVSDVNKIHLITDEIYHKIAPYLKTQ